MAVGIPTLATAQPPGSGAAIRWNLWLPLAGGLVAVGLWVLAGLADRAFRERHELALDGRALRQAHALEVELREVSPSEAGAVLERFLADNQATLRGLAILDATGSPIASAGEPPAAGAGSRDIDLFLGRMWVAGGGPPPGHGPSWRAGGHRGIRTLRLVETEAARRRPLAERGLLPAAGLAGLAVLALAILGGRLLMRQQEAAGREATRRRLEGLARAGAGLAHQLRTPLATLKGSCQLLAEGAAEPERRRLERAIGAAERMEALLGRLLDYSRPPAPEPVDLALAELWRELAAAHSGLHARACDDLTVHADPDHLRQILDNLIDNALQAQPDGTVELGAIRRGAEVEITVDDRGPGPGEDPERLFEPYVTHRAAGTGLGLPIARALAEAGGGSLHLEPRPGGGTRAVLRLRRAGEKR